MQDLFPKQSPTMGGRPVVLVTGCSEGGIGHAVARAFAAAVCAVVATARSRASLRDLEGCLLLEFDVRSDDGVRAVVADAVREHGRVDVLVNNAGVHLVAPLAYADAVVPPGLRHQCLRGDEVDSSCYSTHDRKKKRYNRECWKYHCLSALAPGPWAGAYSASKAALHALSDTLRLELRNFGINVMTVAPGGTKSNLGNSSSAKYDQIHDWKYYKQYEAPLRARTNVSQGPGATPAEEFADKVVASVLKKNPPAFLAYGQFSTILFMLYYAPIWVRDYFYRVVMKC